MNVYKSITGSTHNHLPRFTYHPDGVHTEYSFYFATFQCYPKWMIHYKYFGHKTLATQPMWWVFECTAEHNNICINLVFNTYDGTQRMTVSYAEDSYKIFDIVYSALFYMLKSLAVVVPPLHQHRCIVVGARDLLLCLGCVNRFHLSTKHSLVVTVRCNDNHLMQNSALTLSPRCV